MSITSEFQSCGSYQRFKHVVGTESRYMWPDDIRSFLQTVLETAKKREQHIVRGTKLWRAQL
jgi:hypothetical protein